MELKFKEKQKFTQWWLWILLMGVTIIPLYGAYKQIILGEQFGNNPIPNWGLIIILLSMLVFTVFFLTMELRTNIDRNAIRIKFFPFMKKEIKWEEIAQARIVNFGFVGGWGIRMGTKYGTIYNTNGKIGLALELNNGEKICIGTQKETELNNLITEAKRK